VLTEDLHAIRMYIRNVWEGYAAGTKSTMVAGSMTDAGFELMRHANGELISAHGETGKWYQMLDFLNVEFKSLQSWILVQPRSGTIAIQRCSASNPADLLCAPAGRLLELLAHEFARAHEERGNPAHPRAYYELLFPHHEFGVWFLQHIDRFLNAISKLSHVKSPLNFAAIMATQDAFLRGI